MGIGGHLLQFHLELFWIHENWFETTGITSTSGSIHWESTLTICSTQHKLTGSPDSNQRRSGTVPSGTVWNSIGTDLRWLEYPVNQAPSTVNQNPQLDSLFSPNIKALGVQTGMGVDWLQFHLELFGIHEKKIEMTGVPTALGSIHCKLKPTAWLSLLPPTLKHSEFRQEWD